jgi:hypothetical protein
VNVKFPPWRRSDNTGQICIVAAIVAIPIFANHLRHPKKYNYSIAVEAHGGTSVLHGCVGKDYWCEKNLHESGKVSASSMLLPFADYRCAASCAAQYTASCTACW